MFVRKSNDSYRYPTFYEDVYNYPSSLFDVSNMFNYYECCYGLSYDRKAEDILYAYFIDRKFTKSNFEKSDKYYSTIDENDYRYIPEVQQSIMNGELYSNIVFKSNLNENNESISNVYIASKMNYYGDFKDIKKHKYIVFDFLSFESIKTIDVSKDIDKAMIYFKTKDITEIRTNFNGHSVKLEHLKHDNNEELVPEGEDDVDEYGYRYYRYIINPNAFGL